MGISGLHNKPATLLLYVPFASSLSLLLIMKSEKYEFVTSSDIGGMAVFSASANVDEVRKEAKKLKLFHTDGCYLAASTVVRHWLVGR